MDPNAEDLSNSLKELDKKIGALSSILEKFGLDIITKMGQTNLKIKQLTDKVDEVNKATIDIIGMRPKLDKVIEHQERVEDELNLIKSLFINMTSPPLKKAEVENTIKRDESATDKKDLIINQLNDLKTKLENTDDPQAIKPILEKIKEEIFEFTGGHRMLYEISQMITQLSSAKSLADLIDENDPISRSLEKHLEERITFWINKLMVKN